MSNQARSEHADRTTIVLLGLMAECPLLLCPLAIWRGRSWAPGWWVDAALYLLAVVTAAAVLVAVRRPVSVRGLRGASAVVGGAIGLAAVVAAALFFGDSLVSSGGWLLLGAVVALTLLRNQLTPTAATRS
ncbi:hypothetical protein ACIG0C_33200 [Kitasatospora aureofaciens]|uniref:hypothetical protein n=1 Tax=Kitasatospora aureofaciens TaxID=1894 RepID=UPI00114D3288|nr:hypothetical protein [Kitasatospora aureofaciens]